MIHTNRSDIFLNKFPVSFFLFTKNTFEVRYIFYYSILNKLQLTFYSKEHYRGTQLCLYLQTLFYRPSYYYFNLLLYRNQNIKMSLLNTPINITICHKKLDTF